MSLPTLSEVSNNYYPSQEYYSCSVVDANGNIYTSLKYTNVVDYGGIQKTDVNNVTTLFLQLNSTNTPGSGIQFPTGLFFDSSGYLYYVVFGNNNIYKITDFDIPNPTQFNNINSETSAPFRIVISNQDQNILYISSTSTYDNKYTIKSYTNTTPTGVYNIVFDTTSYGLNYGLAQNFTGQYLYIGISGGRILKGAVSGTSGTSLTLWLTLPQTTFVVGLVFITIYTLIANTNNGYGYKITIDPSSGSGTYELYYDNTTAVITGGLGLNYISAYLYGISPDKLWKINTQNTPTGYSFIYNFAQRDFANVFQIASVNPGIITGYKSAAYGNKDLGEIFEPGNSLIPTNYYYQTPTPVDLGSIFALENDYIWSTLGNGGVGGIVLTTAVDINGNIYVGGTFTTVFTRIDGTLKTTSVNNIAIWDPIAQSWSDVGGGITISGDGVEPFVYVIMVEGTNVYVGGNFEVAGTTFANSIAMWDGLSWSNVGGGVTGLTVFASVYAIASYGNGDIYVGGTFTLAGTVEAHSIAIWNGSIWTQVGSYINSGVDGSVFSIQIIGTKVYIGGTFLSVGGGTQAISANNIAMWDTSTSTWDNVGGGVSNTVEAPVVYSIAINNAGIYVGGLFNLAGGTTPVSSIALLNIGWSNVGGGVSGGSSLGLKGVFTIKTNGTDVYVGGNFLYAGTSPLLVNNISKWDGMGWTELNGGCSSPSTYFAPTVHSILIYNTNMLYASGSFVFVEQTLFAPAIAKYPITAPPTPIPGIPVITTPTYCYKQATISWTNTGTPINYRLYRNTTTEIYSGTNSSYTDVGLINGSPYTYTVKAEYADGTTQTSAAFSSNQPATVTYFNYTGTKASLLNGSYSNIYLTSSGTLTYNCPTEIPGISVVVVGGGGGGGAGDFGPEAYLRYGGGGGGGGEVKTLSITINTSTAISATIGLGGAGVYSNPGNGLSGQATTFIYNTVSYTSTFGTGGLKGSSGGPPNNGVGGGITSGSSFFGGNGGNGQQSGGMDGGTSDYYPTGAYGGGGGGGGHTTLFEGGLGGNGVGGQGGYNASDPYKGGNGQVYGGGGGGGCSSNVEYGVGGNGGNGVVVLTVLN